MKVDSIALEAMVRTLLEEHQRVAPYASVQDLTDLVGLILRNPEGIFVTRIQSDRTRYAQYAAWYEALEGTLSSQYELV